MGGIMWSVIAGAAFGVFVSRPAGLSLPGKDTTSARSGRVRRGFLYLAVVLLLFAGLILQFGTTVFFVGLGVFWFGFLALWLAAIIVFSRKTTGARNARVAREALLVWLLLFAVFVIVSVPGGLRACLITAARPFAGEAAAQLIGRAGLPAVLWAAIAVFYFHRIRCGYVLRPAFPLPFKAEPEEVQRRANELWDQPPSPRARLVLATTAALLFCALGCYGLWDRFRSETQFEEQRRAEHANYFRQSARYGVTKVLSVYLEMGVDVNAAGDNGYTALHVAAIAGHANVAEFLLANNANVNAKNMHDYTPLHFAVLEGHQEVVEALLRGGAHVNPRDWESKTPLRLALDKGHEEIAKLLREHGGIE